MKLGPEDQLNHLLDISDFVMDEEVNVVKQEKISEVFV